MVPSVILSWISPAYSTSPHVVLVCLKFPCNIKLFAFVFLTDLINFGVFVYFISSLITLFSKVLISYLSNVASVLQFMPRQALYGPLNIWLLLEQVYSANALPPYSNWMLGGKMHMGCRWPTRGIWYSICFPKAPFPEELYLRAPGEDWPGEGSTWMPDSGMSRSTSSSICSINPSTTASIIYAAV